jgi:hypothetical protein
VITLSSFKVERTGAIRPGVTGAVSLSDKNLFGDGKSASVQIQAGAQVRSIGLNLLDPAINENQDSLGASIYYNYIIDLQSASPLESPLDQDWCGPASDTRPLAGATLLARREFFTDHEYDPPSICFRQVGDRYQFFCYQPPCAEVREACYFIFFPGEPWRRSDCWGN